MSFSKELKAELCAQIKLSYKRPCCHTSLLYGILLYTNTFDGQKIKCVTESEPVARLVSRLLGEIADITPNIYETEKKNDGESYISYKLTVPVRRDVERLTAALGYTAGEPLLHIKPEMFRCDKCRRAFLTGVFLSGGFINPPDNAYHLELTTPHMELSEETAAFLDELGLPPKRATRKSNYLLYYKESVGIEDFLTYIGAQRAAFDLMNVKIFRDLRNNANRAANCDAANIDKSVSAAKQHIDAINALIDGGAFYGLTSELQITARLRLENDQATLAELAELHTPPITKSGVNHRLKKIIEYAREKEVIG